MYKNLYNILLQDNGNPDMKKEIENLTKNLQSMIKQRAS